MNHRDIVNAVEPMTSENRTLTLLVKGGLGNQLFQLGAALDAAANSQQSVVLSTPAYALDRKRQCHAAVLFPELARLPAALEWLTAPLVLDRIARQRWFQRWVLNDTNVQEMAPHRRPWHWASGYFQNVRYSSQVAERLSRDLGKLAQPNPRLDADYIAVHVRRTDFLRIEALKDEYRQLMRDYYRPAIEQAAAEVGASIPIVVVSDDPDGAVADLREMLGPLAARLHRGPAGTTVWQDLAQLASARALVCSNSTFCWWAARIRKESTFMPARWLEREQQRPGCSFDLAIAGAHLIR